MKKLFAAKNYLSVALAVAAFASVGSASAFAQSRDHTGSMMPAYYDNEGGQVTGKWANEAAPTVRHQALRPSQPLVQDAQKRSAHTRVQ